MEILKLFINFLNELFDFVIFRWGNPTSLNNSYSFTLGYLLLFVTTIGIIYQIIKVISGRKNK